MSCTAAFCVARGRHARVGALEAVQSLLTQAGVSGWRQRLTRSNGRAPRGGGGADVGGSEAGRTRFGSWAPRGLLGLGSAGLDLGRMAGLGLAEFWACKNGKNAIFYVFFNSFHFFFLISF